MRGLVTVDPGRRRGRPADHPPPLRALGRWPGRWPSTRSWSCWSPCWPPAGAAAVDQQPADRPPASTRPRPRPAMTSQPCSEPGPRSSGASTGAARAVAGAVRWLVDLWRQADQQTRPPKGEAMATSPRSPTRPARCPSLRRTPVTKFRHLPAAGRAHHRGRRHRRVRHRRGRLRDQLQRHLPPGRPARAVRLPHQPGLPAHAGRRLPGRRAGRHPGRHHAGRHPLRRGVGGLAGHDHAAVRAGDDRLQRRPRLSDRRPRRPPDHLALCGGLAPPGPDDPVVPGPDRHRQVGHAAPGPAPEQRRRPHPHRHAGLRPGPAARPVRAVPAPPGLRAGAQRSPTRSSARTDTGSCPSRPSAPRSKCTFPGSSPQELGVATGSSVVAALAGQGIPVEETYAGRILGEWRVAHPAPAGARKRGSGRR